MLDFILFIVDQFFNFFSTLDNMIIIGNLSLLKLFIILILFTTLISFFVSRRDK